MPDPLTVEAMRFRIIDPKCFPDFIKAHVTMTQHGFYWCTTPHTNAAGFMLIGWPCVVCNTKDVYPN